MKITNVGRLLTNYHLPFRFLHRRGLKTFFAGLLLFASVPLCLADEPIAKNKTFSVVVGKARGKLPGYSYFNGQSTSGLMFDIVLKGGPFRLALDHFSGGVRATQVVNALIIHGTIVITETDLGARYYFEDESPAVDFYLGGGLALVSTTYENTIVSQPDFLAFYSGSGLGTYIGFGVSRIFESGVVLGFDYRDSDVEFKIKNALVSGRKRNWGISRTSLTLGYNW